jgi:hypothetical protein
LQRAQVKKLLDDWEARTPGRRNVMFRALMNVRPSHLADPALFDFAGLDVGPIGPAFRGCRDDWQVKGWVRWIRKSPSLGFSCPFWPFRPIFSLVMKSF